METVEINGLGAHRIFDAVKQVKPACRVYQASSSEMFGRVKEVPQNEQTPFNPVNPYAASKLYAHNIARIYRESFGLFIACGILFNHESPRRGMHFITQKVTHGAACIKLGLRNSPILNEMGEPIVKEGKLSMGNLQAQRDWGFAGDYVEAMWLMLQSETPEDYVVSTGETHSVREFVEKAFAVVNLEIKWEGQGVDEVGKDQFGNIVVRIDAKYFRPTEVDLLLGDPSKIKRQLGWSHTVSFDNLVKEMVESDLRDCKQEHLRW
jgi:GDPmannose 4,6-dehydratase